MQEHHIELVAVDFERLDTRSGQLGDGRGLGHEVERHDVGASGERVRSGSVSADVTSANASGFVRVRNEVRGVGPKRVRRVHNAVRVHEGRVGHAARFKKDLTNEELLHPEPHFLAVLFNHVVGDFLHVQLALRANSVADLIDRNLLFEGEGRFFIAFEFVITRHTVAGQLGHESEGLDVAALLSKFTRHLDDVVFVGADKLQDVLYVAGNIIKQLFAP